MKSGRVTARRAREAAATAAHHSRPATVWNHVITSHATPRMPVDPSSTLVVRLKSGKAPLDATVAARPGGGGGAADAADAASADDVASAVGIAEEDAATAAAAAGDAAPAPAAGVAAHRSDENEMPRRAPAPGYAPARGQRPSC
jgi:hypothetical protein